MRKAEINLDWLDAEIAKDHYDYRFRGGMDYIRSKCEPVKESFTEDDMVNFAEWLNDKAAKPEYLQYTITGFLAIWKAELEEKQNKWNNEHKENSTANKSGQE